MIKEDSKAKNCKTYQPPALLGDRARWLVGSGERGTEYAFIL